jgi:superfamily I DNA/RNA helicase/mRNA-degrading endonuclease RelE of RelBE toxin-antitoxin system
MADTWILSMKPTFLTELLALPPKEGHQIQEKLALLVADPHPDAKVKKQLKHLDGRLHRLRSGDFRIFYTFDDRYVSVLALRRRKEDTYDEDIDAEFLGGLDPAPGATSKAQAGSKWIAPAMPTVAPPAPRPLPTPITETLLKRLRVPSAYFPKLLPVGNEDELLNCIGVPDELLLKVDEALFERPLDQLLAQPDLVAGSVEDLLKYRDGSLLGFLLRLNPEQEKHTKWSTRSSGPTLLKGGPGTGKSTVALYRVRAMVEGLRRGGVEAPRILFTTYTNALVKFSQQLLDQLLGPDARLVDVRTADSLVREIAFPGQGELPLATEAQQRELLARACEALTFEGNRLQQRAQAQAIARLSRDYLLEELGTVLDARRLPSLAAYLAAPRPGRQLALNATQRTAIWQVHQAWVAGLKKAGLCTWPQARAKAATLIEDRAALRRWDGIVVDEVQDLDPSVIQLLVGLAASTNRLFFTADANQSVYGGAFRWSDLNAGLKFTGRVGVLRANHRSTRELGEAARSWLGSARGTVLDPGEGTDEAVPEYVHTGPLPVVRAVASVDEEAALLARFLPGAAREYRLGAGSCAVFCPTNHAGRRVAERLVQRGVRATFMTGKDLDLARPGVKVMTLKGCKGLEFPVVALAGFGDGAWPTFPPDATEDDRAELLARERRTVFVGMTRAMRALLVVLPDGVDTPLLRGFDPARWNTGVEPDSPEAP